MIHGHIWADSGAGVLDRLVYSYSPTSGLHWAAFTRNLAYYLYYVPTAAEFEFALVDAKARYDEAFKR